MTAGVLMGRQAPTLQNVPGCWSCAGDEVVDLYHSLGRRLDPWQQGILRGGFGEDKFGDWQTPEVAAQVQRQNGKGGVTEAAELAGLFLFGYRAIAHTAHLAETARTAFNRTVEIVDGSADLTRRVKRIVGATSEEAIELMSGAVLKFRTRTGRAGRGISGEMVTFDEAQELSAEQMEALVPTILAQQNPMIWYTFTIPKVAAQFVGTLRARAKSGDPGLAYFGWENPRGADMHDLAVLANVNPAYGYRVSEKTLAIVRGILGEEGFARESGGIWPPEGAGGWLVISEPVWSINLLDEASAPLDPVAIAADATPNQEFGAISVAGRREDGLLHVETIEHRRGIAWIPGRIKELRDKWGPCAVVIDSKRQASPAISDLELLGVDVVPTTARQYAHACAGFMKHADELGDLRHRGSASKTGSALSTAVSVADKRTLEGAWAWDGRTGEDISPLVSATLALWGFETYGHMSGGPNLW